MKNKFIGFVLIIVSILFITSVFNFIYKPGIVIKYNIFSPNVNTINIESGYKMQDYDKIITNNGFDLILHFERSE